MQPWFKMWRALSPRFMAMSSDAQGQAFRLQHVMDGDRIIVCSGETVDELITALCKWLGIKPKERKRLRKALLELFEAGVIMRHQDGVRLAQFNQLDGRNTARKRSKSGSNKASTGRKSGTSTSKVGKSELDKPPKSLDPTTPLLKEEEEHEEEYEHVYEERAREAPPDINRFLALSEAIQSRLASALVDAGQGSVNIRADNFRFESACRDWQPPDGVSDERAAEVIVENFMADGWAKGAGYPTRALTNDLRKWFAMTAKASGHAPPSDDIVVDPRFAEVS